jgi:hypothetical protein
MSLPAELNKNSPLSKLAPVIDAETVAKLDVHAAAIREHAQSIKSDIFIIGRHLTECRQFLDHGQWLPWLKHEFNWTEQTALNYMRVYSLGLKSKTILDSDIISLTALYYLARPSTPLVVRKEIIERAEAGEPITVTAVKDAVVQAKANLPAGETEVEPVKTKAKTAAERFEDDFCDIFDFVYGAGEALAIIEQMMEAQKAARRVLKQHSRLSKKQIKQIETLVGLKLDLVKKLLGQASKLKVSEMED